MSSKRPRQDPVSCRLCRTKKIRCNRQYPCSNCSTRSVSCVYDTDLPSHHRQTPPQDEATVNNRLKRLEQAVQALQKTALSALTPASTATADSPAAALVWFEDASRETPIHHPQPTDQAEKVRLYVVPVEGSSSFLLARSFLPTRDEARRLFWHYNSHLGWLHHIIHAESALGNCIDRVYESIPDVIDLPAAALLLTIIAAASNFWDPNVGIFACSADAQFASQAWFGEALKVLDQCKISELPCLQAIQATIIASYYVFNIQGYSSQYRLLQATALEFARQASFHKIDASGSVQEASRSLIVEKELKRRVWWHIISTDWLLAFTSGSQEGTYLVSPRHMAVNLPLHANDSDLSTSIPLSQPTTMSFFMQRIRFAEVCRTIADSLPSFPLTLRQADPSTIHRVDTLLTRLVDELPPYFRLDYNPATQNEKSEETHLPRLRTQRFLVHLCLHTRRCKLHRPWLVRGKSDARWAFAREACLDSAGVVIRAGRLLEEDSEGARAPRGRLGAAVHHVAMAAVVLAVDVCFSRLDAEEADVRKGEIGEACGVLERAKTPEGNEMASRFLRLLMELLKRHGVELPVAVAAVEETREPIVGGEGIESYSGVDVPMDGDVEFSALLQSCADLSGDLDASEWDEVFASFNSYSDITDFTMC